MTKTRLEAFSDAVIAIVITIMVLELQVPETDDWEGFVSIAPMVLMYLLSFVFLAIYWNNHHHLLHATARVSGGVLWANMHLLFWLSLVPFTTAWVGESELAYSGLPGSSPFTEQLPIMSRVGLNGRWGKAGYGASYRSFGAGFISLTGARVEHDRDESQLWGEYNFGVFRLRGAAGETWERNSTTDDLTLTRTAAATLHLARPRWSTMLSSSYSWIGHGQAPGNTTFAFANGFALAYRPAPLFTIEPSVAFRQERDPATGVTKDTPSAGLALAYAPHRDFKLIGRTSYTRDLSDDPLKDASIVNTTAGVNWNLGRSFLGQQSLTMQFEYKNESRASVPKNQAQLAGSVQFKVAGF